MKSIDWACGKWSENWSCYRRQWCLVRTGKRNREHIRHDSIWMLREAVGGWKFPPEANFFFPYLVARRRACFLAWEFWIKFYGVSLYSNACFQTDKRWRFDKSVFWEYNIWQIYVCHGCHKLIQCFLTFFWYELVYYPIVSNLERASANARPAASFDVCTVEVCSRHLCRQKSIIPEQHVRKTPFPFRKSTSIAVTYPRTLIREFMHNWTDWNKVNDYEAEHGCL